MESERPQATPAEPMRCAHCDCSFNDILRRHEATHSATAQSNGARAVGTRACKECARSRERCTKSCPCQRCSTKGLRCVFPQARVGARDQELRYDPGHVLRVSLEASHRGLVDANDSMGDILRSDHETQQYGGPPESTNVHSNYVPYQQIVPFEMPEYPQNHMLQPTMDFPMNWLPPDNSIAIDYDNIVGLGIGSLDFFSLPNPSTVATNIQDNMQQESFEVRHPTTAVNAALRRDTYMTSTGESSTPWNNLSPGAVESYVSSESPRSAAHAVSPSDAPGGLYATSVNGARMPCTIRARRASRLIPGAKPIRPLSQLRSHQTDNDRTLSFPDISHVSIDTASTLGDNITLASPLITTAVYEDMQQNFNRTCVNDASRFPPYASTRFPDLPSLNMCVRLYFENFDPILPLMHDQVTRISDHWLLALAVSAVGCQYAEAEEYAQMVEPLHEFLRRAVAVEYTEEILQAIRQDRRAVAFAQAMTLSQVGMLYSGSSRLLHFAKAQHSAMIELARALTFPSVVSEAASVVGSNDGNGDHQELSWAKLIFEECKRRIGYSIWLLDCMAVYHFQQQPIMPPDLVPISLPNDKLWQSKSAADWLSQPLLAQVTPSLPAVIVSLFREKQVMADLGQFSRVILLHGVYREIFQLKDCFTRPLGSWTPSIRQAAIGDDESPVSPSESDHGGKSLLNSWRNAALDCVDVLHWAANGTIALQAGAEHPTVLHLHLSRTVLLAPLDRFQTLADSVVSFAQDSAFRPLGGTGRQQVIAAERDILEWAQRDQYKARLAVLHSGCLFWHIRRYSCRAFYEPMAVFLATLTIWAYSSYASRTAGNNRGSPDRSGCNAEEETMRQEGSQDEEPDLAIDDEDTEPAPTFIHLDRPNDDEMVQAFVRFGTATAMRANITGVGDIYSAKGPAKILKEGRKILASVSTAWGRTEKLASVLETLEQVASGRMTLESAPR